MKGCNIMSMQEILSIVKTQLAIDLNCTPSDFTKPGITFCEARENPGRRPFTREPRHFEMLTMGDGVIVSADPDVLPQLRELLADKPRDDAFNLPFSTKSGPYFLPTPKLTPLPYIDGFCFEFLEQPQILQLREHKDFDNVVSPDVNRPDVLAVIAKKDDTIVGAAGASIDCDMLWQIGIDVLPDYRRLGLAAVLVNRLSIEILNRGKIPYYGTAFTNIASQRVALRAGYTPAWMCTYKASLPL